MYERNFSPDYPYSLVSRVWGNSYDNGTFWTNDIAADEFLVIECYRKLDPDTFTDVYNDLYLKRYAIALIKRQWGANLSKFNGVAMLGGVTMNGEAIYSQAIEEIQNLEEQIQLAYETPVWGMIG